MVHHSERTSSTVQVASHNEDRSGNREQAHVIREHNTRTSASAADHAAATMDRSSESDNGSTNEQMRQHSSSITSPAADHTARSETTTTDDETSLPCENRPHFYYPEWTGEECDHDSFFCFSQGINNNCCKCRPECCGECNVLTSFNDPYQACPVLSARAYEKSIAARANYSPLEMILIAFAIATLFGIIAAIISYIQERHRQMMNQDDKTKNLRDYRDQDDVDDGVYRDKPYR
mmetsp:Transcript_35523/g.86105  ORF Transcript_35523/g.86105 Transcript_35523/m.86105 type:complete len:234 (-) Transcript_35523:190-891(-)